MEQIAQFYNVTVDQVLWTSGITFIGQIVGALPVAIIPEIFELRKSGISRSPIQLMNILCSIRWIAHINCRMCYKKCSCSTESLLAFIFG